MGLYCVGEATGQTACRFNQIWTESSLSKEDVRIQFQLNQRDISHYKKTKYLFRNLILAVDEGVSNDHPFLFWINNLFKWRRFDGVQADTTIQELIDTRIILTGRN